MEIYRVFSTAAGPHVRSSCSCRIHLVVVLKLIMRKEDNFRLGFPLCCFYSFFCESTHQSELAILSKLGGQFCHDFNWLLRKMGLKRAWKISWTRLQRKVCVLVAAIQESQNNRNFVADTFDPMRAIGKKNVVFFFLFFLLLPLSFSAKDLRLVFD